MGTDSSKLADPLQRAATHRHVGAPHEPGLAILRPEVQRRDRRGLAPAGAGGRPLEAGPDRPAQRFRPVVALRARHQRGQPSSGRAHVVVDERHQAGSRRRNACVARGVRAPRLGMPGQAGAGALRHRRGGVGRAVVDHDHLERGVQLLLAQGGERHCQIVRPVARRDDHGDGGRGHRAGRLATPLVTEAAPPRVLLLHNRYRVVGGEERSVELHRRALEHAGIDARAARAPLGRRHVRPRRRGTAARRLG